MGLQRRFQHNSELICFKTRPRINFDYLKQKNKLSVPAAYCTFSATWFADDERRAFERRFHSAKFFFSNLERVRKKINA